MEILKGVEPVGGERLDGLMLLAIDVGNTQTLAGVYHGDELLHEWRISTERAATADELAADHDQILRLRGGSLGALDDMVVELGGADAVGRVPVAVAQVPGPARS